MSNKPATVAVATYPNKANADLDYDAVRNMKSAGQLDHIAIAVVEKQADGDIKIDRHDSTAKHLAWGGGILGAVATVAFAPLGIVFLGPLVANSAVYAGAPVLQGTSGRASPRTMPARWVTCSRPASTASSSSPSTRWAPTSAPS